MCMKAAPPQSAPPPRSFRLAQTKEARLLQCALSFSPAHFISSLHSPLLLESTHVSAACVCVCVYTRVCASFMEFVIVVVGVSVCWGSYGPRGQGSEVLLWKRLWTQQVILLTACSSQHWETAGGLHCVCMCVCVSGTAAYATNNSHRF